MPSDEVVSERRRIAERLRMLRAHLDSASQRVRESGFDHLATFIEELDPKPRVLTPEEIIAQEVPLMSTAFSFDTDRAASKIVAKLREAGYLLDAPGEVSIPDLGDETIGKMAAAYVAAPGSCDSPLVRWIPGWRAAVAALREVLRKPPSP